MRQRIGIWAALPLLALIGCSGGNEPASLELELLKRGQENIAAKRAGPAPKADPILRSNLDGLTDTFMEVTIEQRDVVGYVFIKTERKDKLPGNIVVWRTADNVSLTTRNGVLIATRGLGGDILSSTVQVSGSRPGPSNDGNHIQMIRALDDREVEFAFACKVVDLGPETVGIIQRTYSTRHIQQQCDGQDGKIVNDYWVDPATKKIWQSRQWAGPFIGYMGFRRLTN